MKRVVILMLASCAPVIGKLPELDTVFWGQVRHKTNQPLVPLAGAQIQVMARLNGVTIATAEIAPGSSAFKLKVPMDDGINPRLPGTSRFNERVRIFVRSNVLGEEYEAMESVSSDGLLVAAGKDEAVKPASTLSVAADFGSAGASPMAQWLMAYGLAPDATSADADGDGTENGAEFAADTDPLDPTKKFRIMEVTRMAGNNFVKFGPIRSTRQYTIWCSPSLGQDSWSSVGSLTPGTDGDYFLFGHPTPASPNVFYRLEVHAP
ncbi:MAG: hypothetical protein J0M04_22915 [Verrucomicrobia bacterium]|nr:hypothetical protein [Verrucomicrobiota bacterium]